MIVIQVPHRLPAKVYEFDSKEQFREATKGALEELGGSYEIVSPCDFDDDYFPEEAEAAFESGNVATEFKVSLNADYFYFPGERDILDFASEIWGDDMHGVQFFDTLADAIEHYKNPRDHHQGALILSLLRERRGEDAVPTPGMIERAMREEAEHNRSMR